MKVVDMSEETLPAYTFCLEEWSEEMKESGPRKCAWYERMKGRGLRVKLALDDKGVAGGMIQYAPIQYSAAEGKDLYFVYCIWVHGYKQGRGNYRKRGMGKALIAAAEEDVRALGAKGLVVWGLSLPFWMRASWFRKQGYTKVDKDGESVLLWKSFADDAVPPVWVRRKKVPSKTAGKVNVTSFVNGWCPGQNLVYERAKRASAKFGQLVDFNEIDTTDRSVFLEWGIMDGLFIDGKAVRTGPPPSYESIEKRIGKRVRRLTR